MLIYGITLIGVGLGVLVYFRRDLLMFRRDRVASRRALRESRRVLPGNRAPARPAKSRPSAASGRVRPVAGHDRPRPPSGAIGRAAIPTEPVEAAEAVPPDEPNDHA